MDDAMDDRTVIYFLNLANQRVSREIANSWAWPFNSRHLSRVLLWTADYFRRSIDTSARKFILLPHFAANINQKLQQITSNIMHWV